MKDSETTVMTDGWEKTTLENVATWASGGTPSRSIPAFFQGEIPWIKTGELGDKYIRKAEEHITDEAIKQSSAKVFPKGSIGIAMYGATIGKLSIWGIDASTNQACAVGIPFSNLLNNVFLYYYLLSEKRGLVDAGKGGAQPNISQGVIKAWPISLPPLPEQLRIVNKIEELLSELDSGIESFKTAREQLKVYRQALLKHAFEGKLTAAWREENKDKLETADVLLKRMQAERAERFRQQVKEWEKAVKVWEKGGMTGSKPGKPSQPKELSPLTVEELEVLSELPKGWGWRKYGDLCSIVKNGISEKPVGDNGTKIFRISAVRPMFFDMEDFRFIDSTGRFGDYFLERGDLVFTRYNGSRHYVGVCARYNSDERRLFPDKLIQTRIFSALLDTSYLEKAVNCGAARHFIESKIRTTAGQSGISGEDVKNTPVPICSPPEQSLILAELESKLSEIDNLDQTIITALQQAETLRQSILKKAFSGQLVPQDPNDEPASKLLARIKAERAVKNRANSSSPLRRPARKSRKAGDHP